MLLRQKKSLSQKFRIFVESKDPHKPKPSHWRNGSKELVGYLRIVQENSPTSSSSVSSFLLSYHFLGNQTGDLYLYSSFLCLSFCYFELGFRNKRLCIDLSCWMVQLQNASKSHSCLNQKIYLKGLFHRLRALIALNCSLVFVTGMHLFFYFLSF